MRVKIEIALFDKIDILLTAIKIAEIKNEI